MTWRFSGPATLLMPMLLTAVTASAQTASPQTVRIERPLPTIVEVAGGTGSQTWRLRYGSRVLNNSHQASLYVVSPNRAYFTNGPWLRLIDTAGGEVIGRWRFPNVIDQVAGSGTGPVNVTFRIYLTPRPGAGTPSPGEPTSMTVLFDPGAGNVPEWDVGALITYRVAEDEAYQQLKLLSPTADPWSTSIPDAASLIPIFRDLVRRDPSAPLLRVALAKLLRDAGDAGAAAAFEDVLRAGSNDYTDWFRVAAILARTPPRDFALADAAFDRAFADFIGRGRDPRMLDTLVGRLVMFSGSFSDDQSVRGWFFEHWYRLAPTSEATDRAWAFHAEALAQSGDEAAAATWRARAATSSRESLYPSTLDFQLRHDRGVLIGLGSILAAAILLLTRRVRYSAQMVMRRAAAARAGQRAEFVFGALAYWTRRERVSLLLLLLAGWLALGYSRPYSRAISTAIELPRHVGMIGGFEHLEGYPASDERTLMRAIGLQSNNNLAEAERLYRSIPQFAESWNNLGVLLARAGNEAGSREAFGRALAIDSALGEAIYNATGQATTIAAETFQKYAPANMKMMALPARERVLTAYLGSVWTHRYARMWLGPIDTFERTRNATSRDSVLVVPALAGGAILVVMLIIAVAVVTLLPRRDATVPPGRVSGVIELAIPGLAASWRWAGMFVLLTWCTALLAAFFQVRVSSPYFLMAVSQAGILRAFGYDRAYFDLNPPMALLIGVPIVLWLANAALIQAMKSGKTTALK